MVKLERWLIIAKSSGRHGRVGLPPAASGITVATTTISAASDIMVAATIALARHVGCLTLTAKSKFGAG
jgi:hypothetical protein